ncbi:MAG: hypothetical protein ACRCZ9_12330 [Fusobacteriaceae bacterium]
MAIDKVFIKSEEGSVVNVPVLKLLLVEEMIVDSGIEPLVFGFGPLLIIPEANGEETTKTLVLSTMFYTRPTDVIREKDRVVFVYNKGDLFMKGHVTVADITNVEYMYKLLYSGKLPTFIDRKLYMEIILNNIKNNEALDFPDIAMELVMSHLIRDAADPSIPARLNDSTEYKFLSTRSLVSKSSTFAAVTFEDPTTMMVTSITRDKNKEQYSPLEKYSKM